MPQITIGSGGGNAEAGTYVATLDRVDGPREITTKDGSVMDIFEWHFVLSNGETVKGTTSTASGPRSKLYGWLMALNNGKAPKINDLVELNDFRGRRVSITIEIKADGWPKIVTVSAIPLEVQQQQFAGATGAPIKKSGTPALQPLQPIAGKSDVVVSPLRAVAAAEDDLGF